MQVPKSLIKKKKGKEDEQALADLSSARHH